MWPLLPSPLPSTAYEASSPVTTILKGNLAHKSMIPNFCYFSLDLGIGNVLDMNKNRNIGISQNHRRLKIKIWRSHEFWISQELPV